MGTASLPSAALPDLINAGPGCAGLRAHGLQGGRKRCAAKCPPWREKRFFPDTTSFHLVRHARTGWHAPQDIVREAQQGAHPDHGSAGGAALIAWTAHEFRDLDFGPLRNLAAYIKSEIAQSAKVIKTAGVKIE